MRSGLWMGGMTTLFNLLEMQFSVITRYVPQYLLPQCFAKPIELNSVYSLNQRYAKPSDVEEYMRRNNLL